MIILKKSIPRRTFLRGAGATIAIPFVSAMVPSLTALANTPANRPRRLGFVYVPNGFVMTDEVDWWTPEKVGSDFDMTRTTMPLERHRDNLTIVSNLMGSYGGDAGQHTGAATTWLTDAYPVKSQGTDVRAGISIDQVIANQIGQETVYPSMQLAIEDVSQLAGTCDAGYSCAYLDTVSYASPTKQLPMQVNPRVVFEGMFGGTGTAEQRLARMQQNRSILDSVLEEAQSVSSNLGHGDRVRLEDYLENIREVERRIGVAEGRAGELSASAPVSPVGVPDLFEEHVEVMFDLLHVAYQADISRVFTFMMARELSPLSYPQLGIADPHHSISHHGNKDDVMEKKLSVDRYHTELFSKFVDRLASTPDGEGTLLDNTLLMYGSGMSNGNLHIKLRVPVAIVSGFIKGNRHIQMPDKAVPIGDLHVDIAKQMGVYLESFGERSKGGTVGLS